MLIELPIKFNIIIQYYLYLIIDNQWIIRNKWTGNQL